MQGISSVKGVLFINGYNVYFVGKHIKVHLGNNYFNESMGVRGRVYEYFRIYLKKYRKLQTFFTILNNNKNTIEIHGIFK